MSNFAPWIASVLAAMLAWSVSSAQPPRPTEPLSNWKFEQEIAIPAEPPRGLYDFILSPKVLEAARSDLGDLRLFDGAGREVPYAVRIRRARAENLARSAHEFNRVTHSDRSMEVTIDLHASGFEHNRIEVETSGINYRRPMRLEGSDDAKEWKSIIEKHPLTHFSQDGRVFDGRQVSYQRSRYRYLRVRVWPDPAVESDRPGEPRVRVLHTVQVEGLDQSWPVELGPRLAVRESLGGEYASEWSITLAGRERVPWRRLEFDAAEVEFTRAWRLETVDDAYSFNRVLIQGEWKRPRGRGNRLEITLDPEIEARNLRLIIIDQRNAPLTLSLVGAAASARQIVFDRPDRGPLKLYFGNPEASPPGYDFARALPDHLDAEPVRVTPGEVHANATYIAPPVPLTERSPAVTYVVFSLVAIALLTVLTLLSRRAIAVHDAAELKT